MPNPTKITSAFAKVAAAIFFVIAATLSVCAQTNENKSDGDVIRVAFLPTNILDASNAAIFCGARDALREMNMRFGRKFELSMIDPSGSEESQRQKLGALCIDGFSAAIVRPINAKDISAESSRLTELKFYTACVETELDAKSGSIFCAKTDQKKFFEVLKGTLAKLCGKRVDTVCYFKSVNGETSEIGEKSPELKTLLSPRFTVEQFRALLPKPPMKIIATDFLSEYTAKNLVEIDRYDDHGNILFSPQLISDMRHFPKDSDRIFTVCIGALPQICEYLKSGALTACIYDDYYGWGYICARAIAEKLCAPESFKPETKLLPPLKATPFTADSFSEEWAHWLR